eukprot:6465103-Amphidinium_carterae.2
MVFAHIAPKRWILWTKNSSFHVRGVAVESIPGALPKSGEQQTLTRILVERQSQLHVRRMRTSAREHAVCALCAVAGLTVVGLLAGRALLWEA